MEEKEIKKEKLTYDELNNVCHQLREQNSVLFQRLQEANLNNAFRRLDYLFAVLDKSDFFPEDFVKKCIDEVIEMMTIPEKSEEDK